MVYIEKETKRTGRKKTYEMSTSAARLFLYSIDNRDARANHYYLSGADKKHEMGDLMAFFDPRFFEKTEKDMFTVYRVNGTLPKSQRMHEKGIKLTAIENFRKKIREEIPQSSVEINYENHAFKIKIDSMVATVLIFCNYKLDIQRAYSVSDRDGIVDLTTSDKIVQTVNGLFRRQRHYYKRKVDKDDRSNARTETSPFMSDEQED